MARKATASASKSRRLSPEEKSDILRMHAEGKTNKEIADTIKTTAATVGRTIADGSPTTTRSRTRQTAAMHDPDLTKRLKAFAVAFVMDGSVDDDEKSALREIIQQRIAEAQSRAAQEALASL